MSKAIVDRQTREKSLLIEQLKKIPIVQVACEKVAVGRATFYRWRKDDEEFSEKVNQAISEGNALVNDMAESQLMSAIKNNNMTAIIFWLKHHHTSYATRIEVSARLKQSNENLTPEQEALIAKAIELAGIPKMDTVDSNNS